MFNCLFFAETDKLQKEFLGNLVKAYNKCTEERVTYSQLADKYREIYPPDSYDDMLRKCSPKKRLKGFLELHKETFFLDKGYIQLLLPKQSTLNYGSDSGIVLPVEKVEVISPNDPKSVIVIFQYEGEKFPPKRFQCADIEVFKETMLRVWSAKIPGNDSIQLEYQCCDDWFSLQKVDSFEDLLIDDSTKVHLRAIPQLNSLLHKHSYSTVNKIEPNRPSVPDIAEVHSLTEDILSAPNIKDLESPEDINKKGDLKDVINVSIDYLQRSLLILIKSVLTRLYGTADTQAHLSLLTQRLNIEIRKLGSLGSQDNKKVKKIREEISSIVDAKCCLWESSQVFDMDSQHPKDWLYYLKRSFPRKDKKSLNKEVEDLTESNLSSLPADMLLKVIIRATHNGEHIFSSAYISFTTPLCRYDFVRLAQSVLNIRNLYSHPHKYKEIAPRFQSDISEVEKISHEIVCWIEKEDGNKRNIAIVNDDLQHLKLRYKGHELETIPKINEVLKSLLNLNFNQLGYVLFSMLKAKDLVDVSHDELAHLSSIPWSAIIDFDADSKEDGLFSAMCECDDTSHWIKSNYLSQKNYTNPFSYVDLDRTDRADLVKPGHVPWLFPHGDIRDKSNVACPLKDRKEYNLLVKKRIYTAIRAISSNITGQKSEGIVSLVLCYGNFAFKSAKLPYPEFLDDLSYFCDFLSVEVGNVVVLTDNVETCLLLKDKADIKAFNFSLANFCKVISEVLTIKDIPPIRLPTCHGLQEVQFVEEDFVLVHEHIAEHEMLKAISQTRTKIRQNTVGFLEERAEAEECSMRHEIIKQFRVNFYKCEIVSFISLDNGDAITRKEETEIIKHLRDLLRERTNRKTEPAKCVLYHPAGAGATTLARKIVWQLRNDYPCVILKPNYQHSDKKITDTSKALKKLYKIVELPLLMLIDEEPTFQTVPQLTKKVQIDGIPMVFLHVQRFVNDSHRIAETGNADNFFLPSALEKRDAYNFQEKLCIAFDEEKVSAGNKKIDEMLDSMIIPKKGHKVQDSIDEAGSQCGTISEIKHKSGFYEVKVKWDNNRHNNRWHTIGNSPKSGYKRVYIKDISSRTKQLFVTFHFYGIMCLGEEFREPMKDHIKNCLEKSSKEELRILAHLSLLFAFKVSAIFPSRSFEQLCCRIMDYTQTRNFDLNAFIPNSAEEFAVVDSIGQFRVVHSIVAEEILELCLSTSGIPLSDLLCEFLQLMLFDSEYPNKEVDIAINSLLYNREMHYTRENLITRKSFSNVILTIEDKEGKDAAIRVLNCALDLIDSCHAYGHLARYWSKHVNDFEEAIKAINRAEEKANEGSEAALVQNIKGDIYRDKLELYFSNNSPNWDDPEEIAYMCHSFACKAYQSSYRSNPLDYPLNGEIKVRLLLLNHIKKTFSNKNPNGAFQSAASKYPIVAESVVKCSQLFKKLEEFLLCGDGGKDSDSHETSLTSLKVQFLEIIDSDLQDQKTVLQNFIESSVRSEHKVHYRRWYVRLCLPGQIPLPDQLQSKGSCTLTEYHYLLRLLEDNMSVVGHNDTDMQLWLLIVRKLNTGKDMEMIGDKLSKWKSNVSSTSDSNMWVNFYLSIYYFIKLISCNEVGTPLMISNFKACNVKVQEEGKQNKSRSRIKEWLHETGEGFQCLRSGEQTPREMRQFEGIVNLPKCSEQEKHASLSWKGIHVFFDSTWSEQFSHGQTANFNVGFTLRGIRAINVKRVLLSPTHVHSSGHVRNILSGGAPKPPSQHHRAT